MLAAHVDRLHLGVVLDLRRRACAQHPAVVHHRDPRDDAQGDVEVVLDEDEAHVRRQHRQQGDELAPLRRRQPGGGLVEQDQARRAGERHRDLELALLAVRQIGDAGRGDVAEAVA